MRPVTYSERHSIFDRFAGGVTRLAGSPWAFASALGCVLAWALTGPMFRFGESWQMVINTGTTIVTFLMVFLIQQSQNKDSLAVHIKLNELLAAHEYASNRVVAVEDLDEADLERLRAFYCKLSRLAEREGGLKQTHSLDDADNLHARKVRTRSTNHPSADTR
jgi:low affinity Fe/Cu permease